ncbi:RNA-guided endonuclease InsQ/TnpB family protein [Synechocystis sp. PCC 7509]|uniref:RNA-guided endonuclease InsQ/TnpB family protein n=1 Tax=Synechocystis sp. PCC 7509 TaxID=927677 RepID=UPI0002ACD5CB|nr:RNA-guided endonuclease TnpB family protein [Synechocystis sp. PCC 7509]
MNISHQYKLLPTQAQKAIMNRWLDMCRAEYNYLLAERFDWWEKNRNDVNSCPLICHLPELKDNPNYYSQKRALVTLKQERPWYKDVHSQVLQDCAKRVKLAFDRFIKGDCNGNRSGKPRFKALNRYRSFTYTQITGGDITGNAINLSKVGKVKLILHRPIPDGFIAKTAIISKKSDGWYVTISLADESVPDIKIDVTPTKENSVALDLGLEKFAALSTGKFIDIPQYFRCSEDKCALLQQKVSTRKKGSRAKKLLNRKVGKLHQKIARQRKQFHFEAAGKILTNADVVFVENLKVRNMSKRAKPKQDETGKFLHNGQAAKSGLNKSIADAGWASFLDILSFKAEKAGQKVVKVDPYGTSQHCSTCLNKVPKDLSERWHSCPSCSLSIDRDTNSAILIKKLGLDVSLSIKRSTRKGREAHAVLS